MTDQPRTAPSPGRLSRRRLVATGGAGAAALWLGPGLQLLDGIAQAAPLQPQLRRSSWLQITDAAFSATADGRTSALRLIEVGDLPVAALLPDLRDHEGAFALRFTGPAGLPQGQVQLRHRELGTFELFLGPVDRDAGTQTYEAIVDRTVRVAGVNEEGVPGPVTVPEARGEQPAPVAAPAASASPGVAPSAKAKAQAGQQAAKPSLRRVALRRGSTHRTIVAELALADASAAASVHALLFAHGKLVARTAVDVGAPQRIRMRFLGRRGLAHGRYELHLTVVARNGRVTRIRRKVRFS